VRGRRLSLLPLGFCLLAGLFASAGAGGTRRVVPTTISFGVTEDAPKYALDGGTFYFRTIANLGMTEDRVIVFWDENTPTKLLEQAFLDRMMPAAAGTRIVFAIQPIHARAFATDTAARIAAFAAYVRQVALRYPQVQEYVIGNEPNVRRFFQPQHAADGTIVSAGVYERLLAASYDALKRVDPRIVVDGLAISPRGNDKGLGTGAESTSPVRFIAALGAAYRQSGRTTPIADVVDVHAYANINTQPLTRSYQWPQAGAADLDRLKQAWWDAFQGTAQPVFQETGDPTAPGFAYARFRIDESGTQVKIDPTKVDPKLYTGRENVPTVDEATQARYYTDLINLVKCDPTVETLDLFHLVDEPFLLGFQSGLLRVDDSRRPSYAAVKKAIAAAATCASPHTWRHMTSVLGARAGFNVSDKPAAQRVFFATISAGEEATARAGIFAASVGLPPSPQALRASLTAGPQTAALRQLGGLVKANSSRGLTFRGRLLPGQYVFAALFRATMNPQRAKLLVSRPFNVG
jgi:hypothetical protein